MQERVREQTEFKSSLRQQGWREEELSEEEILYELVAEQMHGHGFPDVTGAAVDAVHRRQQGRAKIMHPINQLIAWHLWWRLHNGDEELPA